MHNDEQSTRNEPYARVLVDIPSSKRKNAPEVSTERDELRQQLADLVCKYEELDGAPEQQAKTKQDLHEFNAKLLERGWRTEKLVFFKEQGMKLGLHVAQEGRIERTGGRTAGHAACCLQPGMFVVEIETGTMHHVFPGKSSGVAPSYTDVTDAELKAIAEDTGDVIVCVLCPYNAKRRVM